MSDTSKVTEISLQINRFGWLVSGVQDQESGFANTKVIWLESKHQHMSSWERGFWWWIRNPTCLSYNSDEALCGWRGTELGWGSCGARLLVSSRYSVAHTVEHCVEKEMPTLWSILFNSDDCHMIKSQHVLSSLTLWFGFWKFFLF